MSTLVVTIEGKLVDLNGLGAIELRKLASKLKIKNYIKYRSNELIQEIVKICGDDIVKSVEETKEQLPSEQKPLEEEKDFQKNSSFISPIIDEIYSLDNKEYNKKLCSIFPEDGVEDYSELTEEQIKKIQDLHSEIFNKEEKVENFSKIKTYDIESSNLTIGQEVEFIISSSSKEFKDKKVMGKIVKIYFCGKTQKEYVRLVFDNKIFHKRLSYFNK